MSRKNTAPSHWLPRLLTLWSALLFAATPTVAWAQNTPTEADVAQSAASVSTETTETASADSDAVADTSQTTSEPTQPDTATEPAETAITPVATTDTDADTTHPKAGETVVILHTNDIHGRIEESKDRNGKTSVIGMAKLATVIEETRAANPNTLVLDAGDAFQGMPISNNSKGVDMAMMMNELNFDAMAVGNHEFDFSFDQAVAYKNLLKFPLLSANVYRDGVRVFEPYTILNKNGIRVAVIGATTPETATKTHPHNVTGITFADPIPELQAVLSSITEPVDAYVFLVHLGIDETTPSEWRGDSLAKALASHPALANKPAVVIDGHSHTAIPNSINYDGVRYTQTGSYLNNIGKITFTIGKDDLTGTLIPAADTSNTVPNATIEKMVAAARQAFDTQNAEVVLPNNTITFNGERDDVRTRETNLGNLVADALYHYGQTGFAQPSDLAVTNGGGIRASLEAGKPVTLGDIINVLPFGNIISQIEVSGQQLYDMFAHSLRASAQTNPDGTVKTDQNGLPLLGANGGFLHAAGVKVYFDPQQSDADKRILLVSVYNRQTQTYEPVNRSRTYYLTTNDFLAAGGDGYTMLGGARQEGISLDAVLAAYLRNNQQDLSRYAASNAYGYSRIIPLDALADSDQDGIRNGDELTQGTDPLQANVVTPPANNGTPQPAPQQPQDLAASGQSKQREQTPRRLPQTGTAENVTVVLFGSLLILSAATLLIRKETI